jgi:hypothetical protein
MRKESLVAPEALACIATLDDPPMGSVGLAGRCMQGLMFGHN